MGKEDNSKVVIIRQREAAVDKERGNNEDEDSLPDSVEQPSQPFQPRLDPLALMNTAGNARQEAESTADCVASAVDESRIALAACQESRARAGSVLVGELVGGRRELRVKAAAEVEEIPNGQIAIRKFLGGAVGQP